MVSFRYHVVSIVAVFLALGLGILIGTAGVKQGVIDNLRKQAGSAIARTHNLEKRINDLGSELKAWNDFATQGQHLLIDGQLADRTVALVSEEGVDVSEIDGVRRALADAGAKLSGILLVTHRMALADAATRTQLATLLGLSGTADPGQLARQAAEAVAVRLAQGPPADPAAVDMLQQLSTAQLVLAREDPGGVQGIGGQNQSVVVLSGNPGPPAADTQAFLLPLVDSLVQSRTPVVATETTTTDYDFVGLVRTDSGVDGQVVTVDDADLMPGRVAIVLGLRRLLDGETAGCMDFGVKPGACQSVPSPPSPSPTPTVTP